MTSNDIIEISRDQFEKMYKVCALMQALMDAGVDNWEGYGEALASVVEADHG